MTGDVTEKVCNGVEKRIHKFAAQLAFISTNIMCSSRCLKPTIFFSPQPNTSAKSTNDEYALIIHRLYIIALQMDA